MKTILFFTVMLTAQVAFAQTTFKVVIKDETTKEPVAGATVTVKDTSISATTDSQGATQLSNVPDGVQTILIFSPGYETNFRTKAFWTLGIFGEKTFGNYSLFINAENITDTRQGRFTQVVFPPHQMPTFAEIYTHTEGRVFNGGIKIRL